MLNRQIEDIKRATAQKVLEYFEHRKKVKNAAKARAEKDRREREDAERDRRRQCVCGPDTEPAVELWTEILGNPPSESISEIYAEKPSWMGNYFVSFVFRDRDALAEALDGTHWTDALKLFADDIQDDFPDYKPIPSWCDHWPVRPSSQAKRGGRVASRPLVGDGHYYYLDLLNHRFFFSTGMTNQRRHEHIQGIIRRYENQIAAEESQKAAE